MKIRNAIMAAAACLSVSFTCGARSPQPEEFTGYLFAYFEGTGEPADQEKIRFAYSRDGINWYAFNDNKLVTGKAWKISGTGGVRDPYIMRREDGKGYYMVATDMLTKKNGWDTNPGITLLKSDDLQDWDHAVIDFAKEWPEKFGNVKWVWAPQAIYDPEEGKYLVYFTIRFKGDENLDFYSAYANEDFTGFESEPQFMFRAKHGAIDGDIIYKDGLYHFFFKGNTKNKKGEEIKNGIKQATSRSLKGPWKETGKYVDAYADTPTMVEGSGIFKLNNSDEYILMYDLYTDGKYEFQRSKDLFNFTKTPESFTKNFMPRHGTVMPITEKEARFLQLKFGGVPDSILSTPYSFKNEGNPLVRHKYTADPAPMVDGDTLWLYTGHDMHGGQPGYNMKDWCLFSTTDLINWTEHPSPLDLAEFKWARSKDAYAAHAVKYNGKYYYFISTNGSGIGVAVSDTPTGPFRDAIGKPLVTRNDCIGGTHGWVCIDPAVFIDDDNTPWLFWGNRICYAAKLKKNMTELDGPVHVIKINDFPKGRRFTEAPWVTKRNGLYYLTYASGWPEKISYATSKDILGPYEYRGVISETAPNSNTTHPGIVDFLGKTIFFSHDGTLVDGTSYSRSVVTEFLEYNPDGTIRFMPPTAEGTSIISTDKNNK